MTKPEPTRLPCEIIEGTKFIQIMDYHPDTAQEWGMRIIERDTKFGNLWAILDSVSRQISNAMQGNHQ